MDKHIYQYRELFLLHLIYPVMLQFLQNKTMQMMYDVIYAALEEVGLQNEYEPQDYLNFFCLGNREALSQSTSDSGNSNAANTPQVHL